MRSLPVVAWSVFVTVLIALGWTIASPTNQDQATQITRFVPAAAIPLQQGAIVRIEPNSANLNSGESIQLDIVADNVTDLVGVDVIVEFDPTILQAQDANTGESGVQVVPGSALASGFTVVNAVDNSTGTANYAAALIGASSIEGSDIVLASITFDALADGLSAITLNKADLANGDGQQIDAQLVNGAVQVGQVTQPATETPVPVVPTNTPTTVPTNTPTNVPNQPTNTPIPAVPTNTPIPAVPTNTPVTQPTVPSPATSVPVPPPPVTSPPPLTSVPQGGTIGFCYRVQHGDTLYSLGTRFGINYQAINVVNQLWPPNHIYTNQAIFIPQQMGSGPNFYIVRPGDTLTGVARQCNLSLAFLAQANQLTTESLLLAGQVLRIPIPPFTPPSRVSPVPAISPYTGGVCCPCTYRHGYPVPCHRTY